MPEYAPLRLIPVTLREARRFVGEKHRHNVPPRGWRFGVGLMSGDDLVGVAIASRPVARLLDDGVTLEVIRTCTDGTKNANSMLYGAIARAGKALGYERVITYTLPEESGASLRAAGWTLETESAGGSAWNNPSQGRFRAQTDLFGEDRLPPGEKRRWVKHLVPVEAAA